MYRKSWTNPGSSGPFPNFVDFVNHDLVVDDELDETYVIEWIKTAEDDLPSGQNFTNWECYARTESCFQKLDSAAIEYYSEFFLC